MNESTLRKLIREEASKYLYKEEDVSADMRLVEDVLSSLRTQFPMLGPWRLDGNQIMFIGGDGAGGQERYRININEVPGSQGRYEVILREGSGRVVDATGDVTGVGGIVSKITRFMNRT